MLLVGNGNLLTLGRNNRVIAGGAVLIDGPRIKRTGLTGDLRSEYPDAKFIDARGKLIMPGMINTHMHLYSTFARGMDPHSQPPRNFREILEGLWWKLDKLLTLDDVYYSALVALIECIKNGTTTIIDHHASPGAVRGSLDMLARAVSETGLRAALCYEVSDRDGIKTAKAGIRENADFIAACCRRPDPMLVGLLGLHAAFTLSDETLLECQEIASNYQVGFHLHAAESKDDVLDSLQRSGVRTLQRLNRFGILGPKTIAAHCIHIDAAEIELLRTTGTQVVHNPESNMGNAVGVAPVLEMLSKGVRVGLGTDGYTADMFESAKVANILHKHYAVNPSVAWAEVPQMLYYHNASIGSELFGGVLAELSEGAWADVIVVDYTPPTPMDETNWSAHLLFGVSGRAVETTIINGRIRMLNRRLIDIDEEVVSVKARELAARIWRAI